MKKIKILLTLSENGMDCGTLFSSHFILKYNLGNFYIIFNTLITFSDKFSIVEQPKSVKLTTFNCKIQHLYRYFFIVSCFSLTTKSLTLKIFSKISLNFKN